MNNNLKKDNFFLILFVYEIIFFVKINEWLMYYKFIGNDGNVYDI